MPRVAHGSSATPDQLREAHDGAGQPAPPRSTSGSRSRPRWRWRTSTSCSPTLQDDQANLLPRSATTVRRLKELGRAMVDPGPATGDGKVPAIYTYFGQFVDHDITFEQSLLLHRARKLLDPGAGPPAARPDPRRAEEHAHGQPRAGQPVRPAGPARPGQPGQDADRQGHQAQRHLDARRSGRRARATTTTCPGRAAQHRQEPRPGGPHRRPPQRREPDHRPAPPGLPQGPQPPRRPGPDLRGGTPAAAPALPADRPPRLPQADRRPGDRGRRHHRREPLLRRHGRAVLPAARVHRGRVPLRPHHDPGRPTTTTSTSPTPRSTCCSPSPPSAASWASSRPCPTTGSSSGSASSLPAGARTRPASSTPSSPAACSSSRQVDGEPRAAVGGRQPGHPQPAARLRAADAHRAGHGQPARPARPDPGPARGGRGQRAARPTC